MRKLVRVWRAYPESDGTKTGAVYAQSTDAIYIDPEEVVSLYQTDCGRASFIRLQGTCSTIVVYGDVAEVAKRLGISLDDGTE